LHVYRQKASFEHAAYVTELLKKGGLERHAVSPAEMREIEPNLAGDYYGGFYTQSDSTGDIHKFTHGLAAAVQRRGGHMRYACGITDLGATNDGAWVASDQGRERFDAVVVCAGVSSRAIAAKLGDRVNVYPVKGYSITVALDDQQSQQAAPVMSLLDDETKLVSSRLGEDRLRVAGTAEFNGFNRDIRDDRIQPLVDWVARCFPGVSTRKAIPWAGLRPTMPDMMPKVGEGRRPGVFYNTGHGHLGWTLSAITAEQVATAVAAATSQGTFAQPVTR
jgi:Glycine/D-amino acid oxidases (deaminating)